MHAHVFYVIALKMLIVPGNCVFRNCLNALSFGRDCFFLPEGTGAWMTAVKKCPLSMGRKYLFLVLSTSYTCSFAWLSRVSPKNAFRGRQRVRSMVIAGRPVISPYAAHLRSSQTCEHVGKASHLHSFISHLTESSGRGLGRCRSNTQ